MGMTMTQKILAAHAGLPSVSAGQLIDCLLYTSNECHERDNRWNLSDELLDLCWKTCNLSGRFAGHWTSYCDTVP